VPTLDGKSVLLKIPAGTQSGQVFKLTGKGIRSVHTGRTGDLQCTVQIETPVKLTAEQRELLEKFEATLKGRQQTHSPQAHSFWDKVKAFFGGDENRSDRDQSPWES